MKIDKTTDYRLELSEEEASALFQFTGNYILDRDDQIGAREEIAIESLFNLLGDALIPGSEKSKKKKGEEE